MVNPADTNSEKNVRPLRRTARIKRTHTKARPSLEGNKSLMESFEQEVEKLQEKIQELCLQEQHKKKKERESFSQTKLEELRKCEEDLRKIEKEKQELLQKISSLQQKIFVGGENLLEKAQHQAFLLESTDAEIENLDRSHQQLEETLTKKGLERIDVEEKYSSLQEEDAGLSEKIKQVQSSLYEVRKEHADREHGYQREMEVLLDTNRLLIRENQLACLVIENYIPGIYLNRIESNVTWNKQSKEFQIRGLAFTGNNTKEFLSSHEEFPVPIKFDIKPNYYQYLEKKRTF